MRIIKKKTLIEFWSEYPDSEQALRQWYNDMKNSSYRNFNDIKQKYSSADVIADNRVIFNIKGNKYRLIVKYHFNRQFGYIRFVGIHSQYDKINAETI
ncbi:MAG: type II toxin-antitoxin system HigB family toxin [Spirochaetes bacterium]|nr:type II toxin-antitoxin system HigB family toxin [Spirochaetota bacterium]MBN2770825.1 type II toxin-antitoxin system HigB family toxin [Spirochaetota bacterium]